MTELKKLDLAKAELTALENDPSICIRKISSAEVKEIKLETKHKYGKWVQINSVTCSWYKPAGKAHLSYRDSDTRDEACETLLTTPTPGGRALHCRVQDYKRKRKPTQYIVDVWNVDEDCGKEWFESILGSNLPRKIDVHGPLNHTRHDESRSIVEGLLRSIGPIENCIFYNDASKMSLGLTASFVDPNNVAKAVTQLNTEHAGLGKLSVRPWVSVKFNVPSRIVTELLPDLEKLLKQSRLEHRVRLTLASEKDKQKPSQTLRISTGGTDAPKIVARVKADLEKLLAGTIVMADNVPLWHIFFATSPALPYLSTLSHTHRVYIHRDARKSLLIFYGGSVIARETVRKVLVDKVAYLNRPRQTWVSGNYSLFFLGENHPLISDTD